MLHEKVRVTVTCTIWPATKLGAGEGFVPVRVGLFDAELAQFDGVTVALQIPKPVPTDIIVSATDGVNDPVRVTPVDTATDKFLAAALEPLGSLGSRTSYLAMFVPPRVTLQRPMVEERVRTDSRKPGPWNAFSNSR